MVYGTDTEILKRLGEGIKSIRLSQNLSQSKLAARSAVALNAVRHLENGDGVTLGSFIKLCRTLGRDEWLNGFAAREDVSPIAYAEALKKAMRKKRLRASAVTTPVREDADGTVREG